MVLQPIPRAPSRLTIDQVELECMPVDLSLGAPDISRTKATVFHDSLHTYIYEGIQHNPNLNKIPVHYHKNHL